MYISLLTVCLRQNTNVLEFCSRVEKDGRHRLLYLSGIGTLPDSELTWGQWWDQVTDLMFAQ